MRVIIRSLNKLLLFIEIEKRSVLSKGSSQRGIFIVGLFTIFSKMHLLGERGFLPSFLPFFLETRLPEFGNIENQSFP
jgi:hypothetical protein